MIRYINQPDGSKLMHDEQGNCLGRLMPTVSQATLEASPGIQTWSNPRGKVATKMFSPDGVEIFARQWSRNWAESYPFDSDHKAEVIPIR